MKIAVLISGEYRTFKHCRRTMNFLDDERVDIYVSTWDSSSYVNLKINLNETELVTKEQVELDLGKQATILIDPQDSVKQIKYSTKMMDRWQAGMKLIKDSNKEYDYVIVMRPDLFFNGPVSLDNLSECNDSLGVAWSTESSLATKSLPDILFVSTYSNMQKLIDSLDIDDWINGPEGDWHTWWHNHCTRHFIITPALNLSHCTFYRYLVDDPLSSFNEVFSAQQDWRDAQILYQIDTIGRNALETAWNEHVIANAERKWRDGYFDKFRNKFK